MIGCSGSVDFFTLRPEKATPPDIVAKLNAELVRITNTPEMRARIAELASTPVGNTPQEMSAAIERESEQWGKIIKAKHTVLD